MERQAGLGRSLEDVLDSVPPIEPTEPARTHALFGIAAEEAPVANGTAHAHAHADSKTKTKKKQKKSDGDKKKNKKKKNKKKKKKKKKAKGKQ
ncbi:MAG TPA: hypothetical protein VGN51_25100 [Acidimicrobiia bacterium]|jgi:hypothetical protein